MTRLPSDWDMPGFFPPDDGGFWISGDFAREFHHFSFEFGGILRTFEDSWLGADDEPRGGALPRPDHVVGQTLECAGVFRANVRDHQITLVLYLRLEITREEEKWT